MIEIFNGDEQVDELVWSLISGQEYMHGKIKWPLSIYILSRQSFRDLYGPNFKETLYNPISGKGEQSRAMHNTRKKHHEVTIMDDVGLGDAIAHELTHCRQAEKLGVKLWTKLYKMYKDDRKNDPFEVQAYMNEPRYARDE